MPYSTHNGVATVVPAKPPHGCDKDQYVSKISGAVVAIMRGGGCSFGEKITLAKELGARGVIIVDDDDSDSPSRLQRLMVDDDQEDELGDVFPVVMTIKGFWAENFDVKEGVARNTVYVRVVSGEILIKGIEKMRPPHGCDKDQYVSKISGAVVAIMRGGGCSFGEKITLAKELGARGVIIVDDDDSDSPSRLQRLMVDDDQEDELGDVFPVVMTIKGFWAENFDVKEGVARNTVYVRVVSGEILIKGIEKMRKEMAWRAAGEN